MLLKCDGEGAATKHAPVIGRFGQIAKDHPTDSDELMRLGRYINRVYEERINADYGVEEIKTKNEAEKCLSRAKELVVGCRRIFGLR